MKERIQDKNWLAVVFFVTIGLLLAYLVFHMATVERTFRPWVAPAGRSDPTAEKTGSILLTRARPVTVGKLKLTYQGISKKSLVIDMALTDLDPDYAYRYWIPIDKAKQCFRMSDRYFRLKTVSMYKMQLTECTD